MPYCISALAQNSSDVHQGYAFVKKWGSEGSGNGEFQRVHDLDFDPSEKYLYSVNTIQC